MRHAVSRCLAPAAQLVATRRGLGAAGASLVLASAAIGMLAGPVLAANTYTVTKTADTNDGVCNSDCSLREAIGAATAAGGTSTISVPAGTYTLTLGELPTGSSSGTNITLTGAGAASTIIQASQPASFRIFDVDYLVQGGVTFNLSGVTVRGGSGGAGGGGGGILDGDAGDVLNISNVVFDSNTTSSFNGGAISFTGGGSLSVTNSTFTNNSSPTGNGGAIHFFQTQAGGVSITNSVFSGNSATGGALGGQGGAINVGCNLCSPFSITNSTFLGNSAVRVNGSGGQGGAIMLGSGSSTVRFNRILGNFGPGGGSGVYNGGGTATVTDDWWGCNGGPGSAGCDGTGNTGSLTTSPYIILSATASPNPIKVNQTTTLTASFLQDSAANPLTTSQISTLLGLSVSWGNTVGGSLSGIQTSIRPTGTSTATFKANAAGSGSADASVDNATATASVTVNKANTTATITSQSTDPSVTGQGDTVAFTVTSETGATPTAPTGNVTVTDGTDTCTAAIDTSGAGSCSLASSTAGSKTLTATYAGDADFNASPASAGVAHTVNKADTTTSITGNVNNPSVVGESVTVSYSVVANAPGAGTPTGSVTVSDGTQSCTATVAAGQCSIAFSTPGARSLTATYAGDANFNGSTSASASQQVNKADTTTAITSDNPDPSNAGQSVVVQYTVAPNAPGAGTPTGSVTVSDGVNSCTATVADGQCSITLNTIGSRTLTATYAGDSDFNGSASAGEPHTVIGAQTTTTITSDAPDPSVVGQSVPVQYTVTSSAGTPTGTVTVSDGTVSCTATVAAGQCSLTFTSAGTRSLTASYSGDSSFEPSVSAVESHQVNAADTTTTITGDTPDPSALGAAVTVTYSVSVNAPGAGTPTGNVTVSDGVDSCTGTVSAGQCSITLTTSGTRTLTASYLGDANFNGSTSAGVSHTVGSPTTTTITSDNPDPSVVGQSVTVQYSVTTSGGTATGNVTVSDGTISCTGTVAAGQCSLTFESAGTKSLTATYAGDGTYEGSTSAAESHQVNKADTTTAITSDSPDPSALGQSVLVKYSVTVNAPGAGTPTGNVTVSDGVDSCTGTVSAGQCSIALHTNGVRTLTATYAGDSNFNGSTSAGVSHTVDGVPPDTSITSQPTNPTDSTSATFAFTGSDNLTPAASLTFQCSLDTAAFTACTSPMAYTGLALGSHTFSVRAIDGVGNVDPTPASYTWQVHAATSLLYTGPEIVNVGSTFQPSATLSSAVASCAANQPVSFYLDANPLTGVVGSYLLGTATTNSSGVATVSPAIATTGWLEGVYDISAKFPGTTNCDASSDDATFTVATPGEAASGGGWYTLSGSGRINFGFTVRKVDSTCTANCAYKGSLLLINNGKWRLKGSLTTYSKTSTGQGAASGTGTLQWWDQTLNGGLGGWALAQSNVPFTISFYDSGKTGKSSTDTFGIKIVYTPVAPQPSTLPNSSPQLLKGGDIKVS